MPARYQVLLAGGVFDFQTRTVVTPDMPEWQEYRKWLSAGNTPIPPDTLGQDTLAVAKLKRVEEINSYAAGVRNKAVAGRSPGEIGSWALKMLDAMAIAAGQPSPFAAVLPQISTALGLLTPATSYNDAIAQKRGITEVEHVNKVLAQSVPFLVVEAWIDGVRGKHCDAIEAMTDVRDIIVYDWLTGWPTF